MASTYRPGFDLEGATGRITGLGLDPKATVSELSGGEQAQLALTIAIGTGADVLLLDEPLAALDPLARRDLLALLRSVSPDTTILFASHIVGDLASVCDRLVVLAAGRVAYDAPSVAGTARPRSGVARCRSGCRRRRDLRRPTRTRAGPYPRDTAGRSIGTRRAR